MTAKHFAQRLVHQVRGRVVAHGAAARRDIDLRRQRITDRQCAGLQNAMMTKHRRLNFLRIFDGENSLCRLQHATVTNLTARLGIKRRVIEHDDTEVALGQLFDGCTVLVQRQHLSLVFKRIIAVKGCRCAAVFEGGGHLELASGTRLFLLPRHGLVEGGSIDSHAALATDISGEIERKTKGVM